MSSLCSILDSIKITDILSGTYPFVCTPPVSGGEDPFEDRSTEPAFPELYAVSCVSSLLVSQVVKITPLDDIKLLPCTLENVPFIPINPDQRDTLFPAVTPKLATTRYSSRGCVPYSAGQVTQNDDIGSSDLSTNVLPDSGWEKVGSDTQQVVQVVTVLSRIGFSTTDGLYAFYRDYHYNSCGELIKVSPETSQLIDEVGPCSGG